MAAVVANAIVEPCMVLVNCTHIGLLLPNPIVMSILIRFLLNILIVMSISNINRILITIALLIEVYKGLLKPMVGGTGHCTAEIFESPQLL